MKHLQFNQQCPVCGRRLLVPIELYGKPIRCSHCHGEFEATGSRPYDTIQERAERALQKAEQLWASGD